MNPLIDKQTSSRQISHGPKRGWSPLLANILFSVPALAIILFTILHAAHSGVVSLLTTYAAKTNQTAAVDAALDLNPVDADAHLVRAAILETKGDLSNAVEEYKQAIRARAGDYAVWLSLARAAELKGDTAGAIAAATESIRLAPHYAKPHWLLGNILIRAGRLDEGFAELRLARINDNDLLPAIVDLAWKIASGDVDSIKRAIQPDSAESYKALANYCRQRGKATDAIEMFRSAGASAEQERREYLQALISAKSFNDAASLWSVDHPSLIAGQLIDPGFEQSSNLDQPGFGWHRETKANSLALSLDSNAPPEGRFSLRVDFNGDYEMGNGIISQLFMVEPRGRYQLRFAARSDSIVSGGLPFVAVIDPVKNAVLAQSSPFSGSKKEWQEYVIDFQISEGSSTGQLMLSREPCSSTACPIFGHLWLDNFSLTKL